MLVLASIFGECPQVKILEAFAIDPEKMLYLTEIEGMTGISKITIADHINKFLKEGIVEKKEKIGRKQYYQLNNDNPKVQVILSLVKHIKDNHLEELIEKDVVNDTKIHTSMICTNDQFSTPYSNIKSSSGYKPMKRNSTKEL